MRKKLCTVLTLLLLSVFPSIAFGQDDPTAPSWGDIGTEGKIFDGQIYGFIEAFGEKVEDTPVRLPDGSPTEEGNPHEFDVLNLNMLIYGTVRQRYDYYINLAAPGAGSNTDDTGVDVRNAWLEVPLAEEQLIVRAGKTYRKFGLYNEILDATPTFIGIEAPELFDTDHLLLTRTTSLMLYGTSPVGEETSINYSIATGNDERKGDQYPIGLDVSFDFSSEFKFGSSFYWTGGAAEPDTEVGDGPSSGGVLPWMEEDEYFVYGAYAEIRKGRVIFQIAYWEADHDAIRDEASVLALQDAGLNPRQQERFYVGGDPANGVNELNIDYKVRTAYIRAGYSILLENDTEIVPYVQLDYYDNEEIIQNKDFGGDNEAGLADDGEFWKFTLGSVIRPVPEVALKIDASSHVQDFNGSTEDYYEIRASFSYLWQLGEL